MSGNSNTVRIGKIQNTHGVRGQLRVIPYAGEGSSLLELTRVMVRQVNGSTESFAVTRAKMHGNRVILTLKPFDDINQVLHLVGGEILAQRDELPDLEEDEYYWSDLLGLQVRTEEGELLGELVDIIETGSNDVYVVAVDGREVLVPALEDVVLAVDLAARTMTVSLPEGLLDV